MLIVNVLYEFPADLCPDKSRAEVHEFTVEFGYDKARPPRSTYFGEVTHDTRMVSFIDADAARTWLAGKHFRRLESFHPVIDSEGDTPDPSRFATECWVYRDDGVTAPRRD
jgi:hypothetical protein